MSKTIKASKLKEKLITALQDNNLPPQFRTFYEILLIASERFIDLPNNTTFLDNDLFAISKNGTLSVNETRVQTYTDINSKLVASWQIFVAAEAFNVPLAKLLIFNTGGAVNRNLPSCTTLTGPKKGYKAVVVCGTTTSLQLNTFSGAATSIQCVAGQNLTIALIDDSTADGVWIVTAANIN